MATESKPRPWRIAFCLVQLREQLDLKFPRRSKASDGAIGDAVHATKDSDHNPWIDDPIAKALKSRSGRGVVTAIDVTDESAAGCDGEDLVALLRASRDPRIKYLIFNARICRSYAKPGIPAWEWAPYIGKNAHRKHVHVSVSSDPALFDSREPWRITAC